MDWLLLPGFLLLAILGLVFGVLQGVKIEKAHRLAESRRAMQTPRTTPSTNWRRDGF
jgi:hypothetical protein